LNAGGAWPMWGDRHAYSELMCCGNPVAPGGCSYCEYHKDVAKYGYLPRKEAA